MEPEISEEGTREEWTYPPNPEKLRKQLPGFRAKRNNAALARLSKRSTPDEPRKGESDPASPRSDGEE